MKKIHGLVLAITLIFATCVGYSTNAAPNDKTENHVFLAQAVTPDYVDANKADSTGTAVITNVTTILPGIKVDTVENVQDIVDSGTYLIKSVHKGMNWQEILSLIFGILGLSGGLYYFFRHKNLKAVATAAGIKV